MKCDRCGAIIAKLEYSKIELKAKKEVFDDIEKMKCSIIDNKMTIGDFLRSSDVFGNYAKMKQKHLNTSNTEKVEK